MLLGNGNHGSEALDKGDYHTLKKVSPTGARLADKPFDAGWD